MDDDEGFQQLLITVFRRANGSWTNDRGDKHNMRRHARPVEMRWVLDAGTIAQGWRFDADPIFWKPAISNDAFSAPTLEPHSSGSGAIGFRLLNENRYLREYAYGLRLRRGDQSEVYDPTVQNRPRGSNFAPGIDLAIGTVVVALVALFAWSRRR